MTALLRTGELTRYVSYQQRTVARNSFNENVGVWTEVKKVYAKIEPLTGRELFLSQANQSTVSHKITLHWDAVFTDTRLVAAGRIVYGTRVFNIAAVMNLDEDNRVIEMLASEGLNDG